MGIRELPEAQAPVEFLQVLGVPGQEWDRSALNVLGRSALHSLLSRTQISPAQSSWYRGVTHSECRPGNSKFTEVVVQMLK